MKITLFTTEESCSDLISVNCNHVTMFKDNELEFHFSTSEQMLPLIEVLIKHYVLFKIQGTKISLLPEKGNYQRVRYRFDSK